MPILIDKTNMKKNKTYSQIQIIKAEEVNEAWKKVVNKEACYRFVIDAATIKYY